MVVERLVQPRSNASTISQFGSKELGVTHSLPRSGKLLVGKSNAGPVERVKSSNVYKVWDIGRWGGYTRG